MTSSTLSLLVVIIVLAGLGLSSDVGANPGLSSDIDVVIDTISVRVALIEDGTAKLHIDAMANNTSAEPVDRISFRVESLSLSVTVAHVDGMPVAVDAERLDRYSRITVLLPDPLEYNEQASIHLEAIADDLQSVPQLSTDGLYYTSDFIFYVRTLSLYRNFTFIVVLPPSATLSRASVVPVFPQPAFNFTDGQSIAFVWSIDQIQVGQERVHIVKYQMPAPVGGVTSTIWLPLLLASAVAGLVVGVLVRDTLFAALKRLTRIGSVRFVGVTHEEEEVLDIIRSKGGTCSQKDLYVESDMSQAKVSQLLTNLEERGLVRRFKEGRENVVHLLES